MTWPYSGRHVDYSADQKIASSELNEIQDKIIDLYEDYYSILYDAIPASNAGVPAWELDATPELGWLCIGVGALYFHIKSRPGLIIQEIVAKYYNGYTDPQTPNIKLYKLNLKEDDPTATPTKSAALWTASGSIASGAWGVVTGSSLGIEMGSSVHEHFVLSVDTAANDDRIAGVRILATPQ